MHDSDRFGNVDTGGSSGRIDRLGYWRPETGGIDRSRACDAFGRNGDGKIVRSSHSDSVAQTFGDEVMAKKAKKGKRPKRPRKAKRPRR